MININTNILKKNIIMSKTVTRKVSRKLTKTNKNVKKNNRTRKNLKGSGYGNRVVSGKGKRPMTQKEIKKLNNQTRKEEKEFARLAKERVN